MSTKERQVQVLTCGRTRGGEDKIHGELIRGTVEASLSDVHHLEKEECVKKICSFFFLNMMAHGYVTVDITELA